MIELIFKQFAIIAPELMLTLLALFSQLFAVLFTNKSRFIANCTILLTIALLFNILSLSHTQEVGFNGTFAINYTIGIYKLLVLLFSIAIMIIYCDYCVITGEELKNEFLTLILLSTVGIFTSISSRNFLLLFCGMELQALIGYVLAGFGIKSALSSEGALKYFILGALMSCLTLFGISFIYGFGGSLDYSIILEKLNQTAQPNIGLVVGIVLFLSGIFFKLSAVPLHVWTPDVYEGAQTPAVTYAAAATKIGIVIILLNIITLVIGDYKQISIDLIKIISILSMIVGTSGAIRQTSLKRLMGYSTILNIGYVLMGVSLHNSQGYLAAFLYMLVYAVAVTGFFACIIYLLGKKTDRATFEDIKGLAINRKAATAGITIIVFSMIGIPPFAGFFGKYYLFYQAIKEQQFILAFIAIATSVVAAFYYIKIIRSMYFYDAEVKEKQDFSLDISPSAASSTGLKLVSYLTISTLILAPFLI